MRLDRGHAWRTVSVMPSIDCCVRDQHRRGFSLIELVVALALVSLLAGLGMLGWRQYQARVTDAAARHGVSVAAGDAQTRFSSRSSFVTDPAVLNALDADQTGARLTYVSGPSTSADQVSVGAVTSARYGAAVAFATLGSSGCYGALVVDPDVSAPITSSWSASSCSATDAAANAGDGQW